VTLAPAALDLFDDPAPAHPRQWRLARIEIVNWGTFHGHYRIDVARQGHLFTGASGSGKSSLFDAIATVLTPGRFLRFNAAAQESAARNDDRSLASYVRGAWSKEPDALENKAVSSYLRPGASWSGILLHFDDARGEQVTLARLFSIRAGGSDPSDLKDMAFAGRDSIELMEFEPFVNAGLETKRVKVMWPDAVVTTNGSHKAYFSRLTKLLGIAGENALHLLHKTQSAKNLGSLDQLFRNFMLDEPPTFARARTATDQFGELNEAHRLVIEARDQLAALVALEPQIEAYEAGIDGEREAERLRVLVQPFQDRFTHDLLVAERSETVALEARAQAEAQGAAAEANEAADALDVARRAARALGGADADRARERLAEATDAADRVEVAYTRMVDELRGVGLQTPSTAAEFAELQEAARHEAAASGSTAGLHEHADQRGYFEAKHRVEGLDRELRELRSRRSNLPARLQEVRRDLAAELGLSEATLPFGGELIEVRPNYAEWTGAIERVLRPFATTLLVRDELLPRVRRAVEGRNLGTRLLFEAVPAIADPARGPRTSRSLLHRIRVADSALHDWLAARLASEFDYDCVETPDELDGIDRGVTRGGQVKKSSRRYEKNDRDDVNDRTNWVLGGDNQAKVEALLAQRRKAERSFADHRDRLEAAQRELVARTQRRTVLDALSRRAWAELDREAAAQNVLLKQRSLVALTDGNHELTDALQRESAALDAHRAAQKAERDAALEAGQLTALLTALGTERDRLATRIQRTPAEESPTESDSAALEARYRGVQRRLDRTSIADVGLRVSNDLHVESRAAATAATTARSLFEEMVHRFRTRWPVASADLTGSIDDRAGYRALRVQIESRGLPEHEQNFLRLLRERSRDSVGYLLSDIRDAPKLIKERIDPVNVSLRQSLFDRDRYLRIRVREQRGPEVQQFIADLKSVTDGSWGDDDLTAAERRFAVLEGIMTRLASSENADQQWKNRCLDTRGHVTFQAEEIDADDRVMSVHDSSAGLSGGQRQKLVIFCLAAALRFQLAPDEESMPRFGTVILDEAFDKADSSYTRMAMDVFVTFGFHMILATPQKLLTTLEPYVGAVTSISNETRRRSTIANVVFGTGEAAEPGSGS
jgi:uncharacterized protein YPO0396